MQLLGFCVDYSFNCPRYRILLHTCICQSAPPASPATAGRIQYAAAVQAVPKMKAMKVLNSDSVSSRCALP